MALLTIGNSFADDSTAMLPALAEAGGKELTIFRANLGGASMERHARHLNAARSDTASPEARPYKNRIDPETGERRDFSLPEALAASAWDFVTIQQVSWESFRPETYHPHADQLIAAVREFAPQAEILIHQTWAYREDHPIYRKNDGFTPEQMHDGLRSAYRQLAEEQGFRRLLVGDAFNLARQTERWGFEPDADPDPQTLPPGQLPDDYGSLNNGWYWKTDDATGQPALGYDGTHANVAGRYLGACVFYLTLFGADELPATFVPDGLSATDAAGLRAIALAVVLNERARESSRSGSPLAKNRSAPVGRAAAAPAR